MTIQYEIIEGYQGSRKTLTDYECSREDEENNRNMINDAAADTNT